MGDLKRCEKVINQVSAILDGDTSAVERIRFKAHLAICPSCKRYVRQFRTVKDAAGLVTEDDLPNDFDKVMGFVLDQTGLAADEHHEG